MIENESDSKGKWIIFVSIFIQLELELNKIVFSLKIVL